MQLDQVISQFKEEGFRVTYFDTSEEAVAYLCTENEGKTIGFGGSVTLEETGLFDALSKENTVFWHWKQPSKEARDHAANAEVYITSANAVSQTGEIVNIDGTGNRVAAINYGHEKVYVIIGINKIEDTLEQAIWRARNIAAPLNARRLHTKTPCAMGEEVRCYDCKSPERICRGFSIINRKMSGNQEMELVLIDEALGY
ncbi:MAG: lactate utilization protein [Lachnospiraceae bacterium]|nr:lactate utilization protein [Lachnospiraceae bacterium]